MGNDKVWWFPTEGVEMGNDKVWWFPTEGVEMGDDKGSHGFLFYILELGETKWNLMILG